MRRALPPWQPFDPDRPDGEVPELPTPDGPILTLLVSPGLHGDGWAGRAAARIARRGIAGNGRILLADLGLDRPHLHEVLGVNQGEGMSDAFVFGASIQRVAQPTKEGFLFASAGTPVAEPGSVLASPRWRPVAEAFRQAGAHLLLYVPWDLPGREALLARASSVAILATPEEAEELADGILGQARVDLVLGPGAAEGDDAGEQGAPGSPVADARAGDPAGPSGRRPAEVGPAGAVASDAEGGGTRSGVAPGRPTDEEARDNGREQGRGGRLGLLVLLFVLLLLGVLGAALLGFIDIPGIPEMTAGPTAGPTTATTEAAAGAGIPEDGPGEVPTESSRPLGGPHHAWSLMIASFQDPAVGLEQAGALQRIHPERLFHLAPVQVGGATWYRLLVGPAADSLAASDLRQGLNAGSGAGWRVRPTPLAFQLAEVATAEEASALVDDLPPEIPGYALAVVPGGTDTDGEDRFFALPQASDASPGARYRVYVGGYSDAGEATLMEETLRNTGFGEAPLVQRVGFVPPGEPEPRRPSPDA